MFEFRLPDLGEGIHEGELIAWKVAVGDRIEEDDPLCEVETDKAAVTIPSPRAGTVISLAGKPGDILKVGEILLVIDDGGQGAALPEPDQEALAQEGPRPPERNQPPEQGEVPKAEKTDAGAGKTRVLAAPATRRLAREMGIDIREVKGSGPGGRVTAQDLEGFGQGGQDLETPQPAAGEKTGDPPRGALGPGATAIPFLEVPSAPVPVDGPVERIPIRSLRRKTAIKTTSSAILIPHVAQMEEIDVTELEEIRRRYNSGEEGRGRLTLLAFVVKALAALLKEHPMFNASVDAGSQEIIYKKYYHLGFAADTPRGLVVPVIHDADRQSLAGLAHRIRLLSDKAREGTIEAAEMAFGTFTVTNVGALGGTYLFPIINAPESAILGMGRVTKKPVVRPGEAGDEIQIRQILPVTLCFDHRVADGAQAAAFVRDLKQVLESGLNFLTRI